MGLLENKVAIVSGIGPGMGRDISLAFAREGADVVLGGRTEKKLLKVAGAVEELGRRALPITCDIADAASCDALVEHAVAELGGVDILVNNAFHNGDFSTVLDADLDDWRATMDVNLFGALNMVRAVHPSMKERGDGRIIMVNTMSTQRIERGWGAYAASKGALATVTKTLAMELGPDGIRVNALHPGYIWGRPVEWFFEQQAEQRGITPEEVYAEVASGTCLGYLPDSAEIAGTVVYFASDLAKPVTGQMIGVNAGHWFN
jgi:NAD(P)-dependent dehydrogenase (short-subunit alcohol dehydrogenase family)